MNPLQMLERLVAFDTTSRDPNLPLIEFVADYLDGHGVQSVIVGGAEEGKANLWATIGPESDDGVILSGHTDCVPVDEQPWSTDPFVLTTDGDRLYGRGTSDMKAFVAAALAAVPRFVASGLERPIHLALSYDEEVGGAGAKLLVDELVSRGVRASYCVVGEPTSMQVVTAHKGIFVYKADVTGTESHSSLAPRAVNAAEYAARLLVTIQDLAREKAAQGPYDEAFDIPHTTLHAGVIHAGTALNIVPSKANLEFEFRHLPDDDPEPIKERIERAADRLAAEMGEAEPSAGIELTVRAHLPALDTDSAADVVATTADLTEVDGLGKVAYGTEAGLFDQTLGVPTVVCGPGSIQQAHKPDEWIERNQLDQCDEFMSRLAASLS